MSSWFTELASSHRLQLALTAVASGFLAASAVIGLQEARRRYEVHDLKASIPGWDTPHDVEKINEFGGAVPRGGSGGGSGDAAADDEDTRSAALARRAQLGDYDEDLILEQLARNRVFLTDAGLARLREAFVIVVGCGGVGSHAAAALARSGCGKLRLIDFDQVTLSSLNRHAVATLADVGTPKVECLRKRLEQVVPWTRFECVNALFTADAAEGQLGPWTGASSASRSGSSSSSTTTPPQPPTFVIDAIDNIDTKVALLAFCHARSLPVVASMGAGCKSDPTRIFLSDISASTDDPLSRATRRRLRLQGIASGIPVVFSGEKTTGIPGKAALLPLPDEQFRAGAAKELGILPDFRARILPVLGTMPATFGLCVANHVILSVAGYPGGSSGRADEDQQQQQQQVLGKARGKMYEGILAQLQGLEERVAAAVAGVDPVGLRIPVTAEDVGYLVEEVYRGRSVVTGLASRLALTRWRRPVLLEDGTEGMGMVDLRTPGQKADRLRLEELVCMTRDEVARHEKVVLKEGRPVEEVYDAAVVARVESRMAEERAFRAQW